MRTLVHAAAGALLLAAALPSHASNTVRLDSRVERVILYPSGADIGRVADPIALAPGTTRVLFSDLPAHLDAESVRVTGSGDEGVHIRNVEVIRQLHESGLDEISRIEVEADSLDWVIRHREQRKFALETAGGLLATIKRVRAEALAEHAVTGTLDGEQLRDTVDALVDALAANGREQVDIERELAVDQKLRHQLGFELEEHRQRSLARPHDVLVDLHSEADARVSLEVLYTVQEAGWTPVYDVWVAEDLGTIRLDHHAFVRQKTREDWRGVELELSTARPSLGAQLPELSEWWLVAVSPPRPPAPSEGGGVRLSSSAGSARTYIRGGRKSGVRTIESASERVVLVPASPETQFATRFQVPGRIDLPSDGERRRLAVSSVELDGKLRYEAVPKLSPHAFLVADVRNAAEFPLLAGETRVELGGQFLGGGRLPTIAPGEDFTLVLGADPSVRVSRQVASRKNEPANRDGSERRHRMHYRIDVRNFRTAPVDVRVLDQMPLSPAGELKVSRKDTTPEPIEEDGGRLRWDLVIPPADSRTVDFGFEVRYPADQRPRDLP